MKNNLTNKIQEIDEKFEKFVPFYKQFPETKNWSKELEGTTANYNTLLSFLHTSSTDLIRAVIEVAERQKKAVDSEYSEGYVDALTDLITILTESIALGDNTKQQ